jgi:hypothetical protein
MLKAGCRQNCPPHKLCEPGCTLGHSVLFIRNFLDDVPKIGFDDSLIYREIAQPHALRKIPMIQMMREEALAAFRAWENKPNKIEY